MLANQNLIRENKSIEAHLDQLHKRYPYSGQDSLTGKWYEQIFPYNDIMCIRCAKKYYYKDRDFIKDAKFVQKADLCRFCGQFYDIPSNFIEVNLLLGRDSFKRISRLDQYRNTNEAKPRAVKKTERLLERMQQKRYK